MFLIRRKLGSKSLRVIILTLHILESLVHNCGPRLYSALNDEAFMRDMGKLARKYAGKHGSEYKELTDVCLDMIQAWGEAFLQQQAIYPNITKTYFDLCKEGIKFPSKQFDENRVPLTKTNVPASSRNKTYADSDANLAAALAASLVGSKSIDASDTPSGKLRSQISFGSNQKIFKTKSVDPSPNRPNMSTGSPSYNSDSKGVNTELIQSACSSTVLLSEIIMASTREIDIIDNDVAQEISTQLKTFQNKTNDLLEEALIDNPEVFLLLLFCSMSI